MGMSAFARPAGTAGFDLDCVAFAVESDYFYRVVFELAVGVESRYPPYHKKTPTITAEVSILYELLFRYFNSFNASSMTLSFPKITLSFSSTTTSG